MFWSIRYRLKSNEEIPVLLLELREGEEHLCYIPTYIPMSNRKVNSDIKVIKMPGGEYMLVDSSSFEDLQVMALLEKISSSISVFNDLNRSAIKN